MPLDHLHRRPLDGPINQVIMMSVVRSIQMYILPGGRAGPLHSEWPAPARCKQNRSESLALIGF